ncbi:MAG: EAL domain-containing protein, partial [Sulfurimonas sp.]|nr:EAL domain-containing protein [Sulfurimonas sp.]
SINDFAHSLGIKTIAEFVHCKEVFLILQELGVDEYQGYYFSEPLEHL